MMIALQTASGCREANLPNSKSTASKRNQLPPNHGSEFGQASRDRGFNLHSPFENVLELRQFKVRLAYNGTDFIGSCGAAEPTFLPEIYSQKFILNPYSHGKKLFAQLISSWEKTDPEQVTAPATPAHPMIGRRLGNGTDPNNWMLNLIRFRSDHIKMNYELPLLAAGADGTLEFAALIHAFKIPAHRIKEYQEDVSKLTGPTSATACLLRKTLDKWLPVAEYFFVHSNFFDLIAGVREWRFTEAKLVSNTNEILSGPSASASGLAGKNYALRMVMMAFPYKQLDKSGSLVDSTDGKVYRTFWSGESTDSVIDLLSPIQNGGSITPNHPAFEHDSSMTCAQCHARGTGPVAIDPGAPFAKQMAPVKSMHFRHVGFGIEPPHGIPRLYNEAQLSMYFQQLLLKESGQ